jgi:hypothetical protein
MILCTVGFLNKVLVMLEEEISYSFGPRRIEKMIHVRMGDALYNSSVLTDKYFTDFCKMLLSMEEVGFEDILAIEKIAEYPEGTFALWCDGSSIPLQGTTRVNATIAILRELECRLQPTT